MYLNRSKDKQIEYKLLNYQERRTKNNIYGSRFEKNDRC